MDNRDSQHHMIHTSHENQDHHENHNHHSGHVHHHGNFKVKFFCLINFYNTYHSFIANDGC